MASEELITRFCEVVQELAKSIRQEGKTWGQVQQQLNQQCEDLILHNVRWASYIEDYPAEQLQGLQGMDWQEAENWIMEQEQKESE